MIVYGRMDGLPGLWFYRVAAHNVGINEHGAVAMIVRPVPSFELRAANWNYVL